MRLAIHYSVIHPAEDPARMAATLAATVRAAEDGGCSRFTLMDHWFQMEDLGGPAQPMLEGYTSLGYLAALTSRIELGLLVTGVTYRHPGLLAKQVATLDILSAGRAFLGIGAAWYEREHLGLGVPFPALGERFERLEETLQICRQVWGADEGAYAGRHYQLAETVGRPAPLRTIPVLVGGGGERKTLRLVATYADACNLFATTPEQVAHKIEVLDRHCEDVGRDPATVERTLIGAFDVAADPDAFLREMERYAAVGISTVWTGPFGEDPAGSVARTCELVSGRLASLS